VASFVAVPLRSHARPSEGPIGGSSCIEKTKTRETNDVRADGASTRANRCNDLLFARTDHRGNTPSGRHLDTSNGAMRSGRETYNPHIRVHDRSRAIGSLHQRGSSEPQKLRMPPSTAPNEALLRLLNSPHKPCVCSGVHPLWRAGTGNVRFPVVSPRRSRAGCSG
jgi:hypothetical protein